jgi:hypothetical protein
MPTWFTITGVTGIAVPMSLDLLGVGDTANDAMRNAVHGFLDGIMPVLRRDLDPSFITSGMIVGTLECSTNGHATTWDVVVGPAAIGGSARSDVEQAVGHMILMRGIQECFAGAAALMTPHWLKLFIVRHANGDITGDLKIDGLSVGFSPSFRDAAWPPGADAIVRQFAMARPRPSPT